MSRAIQAAMFLLLVACADADGGRAASGRAPEHPYAQHALALHERSWCEGDVLQRLAAGPYVYLRVRETSGSEVWLVSLRATTPSSTRVRALVLGRAAHFRSRRLGREFSPLLFAAVRGAPALADLQPQPGNRP